MATIDAGVVVERGTLREAMRALMSREASGACGAAERDSVMAREAQVLPRIP